MEGRKTKGNFRKIKWFQPLCASINYFYQIFDICQYYFIYNLIFPLSCFTPFLELTPHSRWHFTILLTKLFLIFPGEKRFCCPICDKRFMRSDHLNKHAKRHPEFDSSMLKRASVVRKPASFSDGMSHASSPSPTPTSSLSPTPMDQSGTYPMSDSMSP